MEAELSDVSTGPPAPPGSPPSTVERQPRPPRWKRWLGTPWVRSGLGLLVLAAIVGGLLVFENLSSEGEERLVGIDGSIELGPTVEPGLGALDGRAPERGQPAPQFALRDPDGNVHRLGDYLGRPVWINFWATWCGPCRRELPDIQRLADEFAGDGLVVLAVNFQQPAARALAFWDELDLDLPILLDSSGGVASQYRLRGFPDSFFIDREGVLRALQIGFLTEDEMREKLAEVGLE